ncbi:hypothetical protein ABIF90_000333 [Bradyrhizobium japonicum]
MRHLPPTRRLASQWWGVTASESTPEPRNGRVVPLFPKGMTKGVWPAAA